jgi:hypothetical protein
MIAERKMHPGPVVRLGELFVGGLVDEPGGAALTKREAPNEAGRGFQWADMGGTSFKYDKSPFAYLRQITIQYNFSTALRGAGTDG